MPNYVPYLFLIFISLFLFIFSWKKSDSKKLIPFYLSCAGFIYLFEFIVLVLFKAYVYLPGVFKNDYFDNIFGANVSDGFIAPSTAVFIAIYDLNFWWIVLITSCFLGLEVWFLHLDVYRHLWWKTFYTGLCMPLEFLLGKWLWKTIRFHMNRFTLLLMVLYFTNAATQATVIFYFASVFHLLFFHVGWFDDPTRGHIAFASSYVFIDSLFFGLVVIFRKNRLWKVLWIVCITCVDFALYKMGVLAVSGIWVIGLLMLFHIAVLLFLIYVQKLLVQKNKSS